MSSLFEGKCIETVQRVLIETRNRPDIEVQRSLTAAFPFNRGNVVAWRIYAKEIYRQSQRKMYGYVQNKVLSKQG